MSEHGYGCVKDTKRAMELYLEAGQDGCACAMEAVGTSYEAGDIVECDPAKAFQWYAKTLDYPQNTRSSLKSMASCYEKGIGCDKNAEMSANLLKLDQLPLSTLRHRCPVCLEKSRLAILPCRHEFHRVCLAKCLLSDKIIRCGLCRVVF